MYSHINQNGSLCGPEYQNQNGSVCSPGHQNQNGSVCSPEHLLVPKLCPFVKKKNHRQKQEIAKQINIKKQK